MSQQPPEPAGQEPPRPPMSPPSNSSQSGGLDWRRFLNLQTGMAVVIVGLLALLLYQSTINRQPQTEPTATIVPTSIEQATIVALQATIDAAQITPTIDPTILALQAQNTQLAQEVTNQAATSQAALNQPTQAPQQVIVQQPTAAPIIITATPLPVRPTQAPAGSSSVTVNAQSLSTCPTLELSGVNNTVSMTVDIPAGEIAFIDGYKVDDVELAFLTLVGPYRGTHTIQDGAFCGGIPINAEYASLYEQRIGSVRNAGNYSMSIYPDISFAQWQSRSFQQASGTLTLGDSTSWTIFQGWDGSNSASLVHGVIAPGYTLSIPAPFEGTVWMTSDLSRDLVVARALQMRREVVIRDNLRSDPRMVYAGSGNAPQGLPSDLPRGWRMSGS